MATDYTISVTAKGADIGNVLRERIGATNVGDDKALAESAASDFERQGAESADRVVSVMITGSGTGDTSRFRREITVSPLQADARTGARATVDDGTNRVQNPAGIAGADMAGGAAVVGRGAGTTAGAAAAAAPATTAGAGGTTGAGAAGAI